MLVDKTSKGYPAAAQKAGGQGILYNILATPKPVADSVYQGQQRALKLFHNDE